MIARIHIVLSGDRKVPTLNPPKNAVASVIEESLQVLLCRPSCDTIIPARASYDTIIRTQLETSPTATYSAWWEWLDAGPQSITNLSVNGGDTVLAQVSYPESNGVIDDTHADFTLRTSPPV